MRFMPYGGPMGGPMGPMGPAQYGPYQAPASDGLDIDALIKPIIKLQTTMATLQMVGNMFANGGFMNMGAGAQLGGQAGANAANAAFSPQIAAVLERQTASDEATGLRDLSAQVRNIPLTTAAGSSVDPQHVTELRDKLVTVIDRLVNAAEKRGQTALVQGVTGPNSGLTLATALANR